LFFCNTGVFSFQIGAGGVKVQVVPNLYFISRQGAIFCATHFLPFLSCRDAAPDIQIRIQLNQYSA
jgi:hypothetical protein